MFLYNYLKFKNNKETLIIILLFFFSLFARIPVILILGDVTLDNEWGILLNNLINHNTLSLQKFDEFLLPNLWLPPLYAYYLYLLSFLNFENQDFVLLVLLSQVILASISVVIFYKLNKFFFSKKISAYSSLLFSFFPLYLYASAQISSISLTIFLAIFFYYFFFKIKKDKKYIDILIYAFIGGLLILVRREFIAIIIVSSFYLFLFCKISFKKILLIFLITLVTISPYLMRNYMIFEKVIIHSGFGYNLWQGNNPNSKVEGAEFKNMIFQNLIDEIPKDKFYRINEDKIYIKESIKNIKEDPKKYFFLYVKKALSYFFIDIESTKPNYYNPFHYMPNLLLAITSLFGIFLSDKKSSSFNYLILILSFYLFVFPFFAIQPRYKIYIIPFQIIFTNIFINYLIKKRRQRVT